MPGTEIELVWPGGPVEINDSMTQYDWAMSTGRYTIQSADPNDHYRPWLEQHVGRQGWDWDWRIGKVATTTGERDTIRIKIRRGRAKYATIAALRWT